MISACLHLLIVDIYQLLIQMFDIEFYHIILGYVYCLYIKKLSLCSLSLIFLIIRVLLEFRKICTSVLEVTFDMYLVL